MSQIDRASEEKRYPLAEAMPFIVWTQDPEGSPRYFNPKWTEYTGLDLAETLRIGPATTVHSSDRSEVARLWHEARGRGDAFETRYRLRDRDGRYRWHLARIAPLRTFGVITLWVGTAIDVDEQCRVHEEQRFLIEASTVLGTSLDLGTTLGDVARLVVPHLADWCAVDLLTDEGVLERPAVAHVDPSKVALAWELWRRHPPSPADPHGVYAVVRDRRSELIEDVPDELLVASIHDPDLLAVVRSLGLRSSMCVPLVVRDRALGALTLISAELGRRYGARDLAFAEELARRMAVAVDNARLYGAMKEARAAAEAIAADVVQQSRDVQATLLSMRAERDAALAQVEAMSRAREQEAQP